MIRTAAFIRGNTVYIEIMYYNNYTNDRPSPAALSRWVRRTRPAGRGRKRKIFPATAALSPDPSLPTGPGSRSRRRPGMPPAAAQRHA